MDIPAYQDFFKQIKINLWLLGIPYGDYKIHLRFYILLGCLIIMITAESAFFVSRISSDNFLELTQLAPCLSIGILSVLKIVSASQKRRQIFELSENLRELYDPILADIEKRQLVKHDLVLVNMLMKYFFVLNVVLITVYNFSTLGLMAYHYLTSNELVFMLPYSISLPFSTDAWIPWGTVYLHSIVCGFICVLFYSTVDGLYFVLTSQVCANFCALSNMIGNLDETNVDTLTGIVNYHQYILKLGKDLEDIFTAANLFNVLVGSLEICALGFNLTTGSWDQIPGSLLFLISVLLQILMMSVFGENIIKYSSNIGDSAFLCNWYKMDPQSKKKILIIMIRSHKPQVLTAYKFSVISYSSFTKIISTSWSYFTILRTVYKPPDLTRSEYE